MKIVYYGPGLSGKTTNLQYLHSLIEPEKRGKLISLATEADRTLFFDFMPVELGKIKDFSIRFQLYTVPGQVRYNATRKLVLKGADAVVFVADSQRQMLQENLESLNNMRENLLANNIDPDDIPVVMQYNKRDLPDILSVEELNSALNKKRYPYFEAVAIRGEGVKETFQEITRILLKHISQKHRIDITEERPPVEEMIKTGERAEPAPQRKEVREDIALLIQEMKETMKRVEESLKDGSDIRSTLQHIEMQIKGLKEALHESNKKHDDILKILRDIRNAIDRAKVKRRWLLFR